LPDSALQFGALLAAGHDWFPVDSFILSSPAPPARTHSWLSESWNSYSRPRDAQAGSCTLTEA